MRKSVVDTIINNRLIKEEDNILIGVSGGPDSIALLDILKKLRSDIKYHLIVAHVNHGVRGEEADKDETYVKNVCEEGQIPFYSKKVNMEEYAKKHGLSSEEAGRVIRYSFFREILSTIGGGKIAVGHNKNDQAETLILRFFRGTGIDGLKGMDYKNNDIIRPLLDIEREEIEEYCEKNNLNPRVDKTNLETIYGRNKVRLDMIPYIKENFNEGIIDTLVRTSRVMKVESDFLNKYAVEVYERVLIKTDKHKVRLNNKDIIELHKGIRARVIRYSIEQLIGHLKGIEEKHITDIIKLSKNQSTGKKIHISNNIRVKISYNDLIIEKVRSKPKGLEKRQSLKIDGVTRINDLSMEFETRVIDKKDFDFNSKDRFIKYFDYDKINGDLFVRTRKAGDRFAPLGMKGTKKIKDFFIDEKIPRDERDNIPFIVDEEEIMWVFGYRISNRYKITEKTNTILKIQGIHI